MAYSNSPLVNYKKISPNRSKGRVHATHNPKGVIDTITIHHTAGKLSIESLGNVFAPSTRQASSNYGVGDDGRIGLYCEEKDRSWCTSNAANDYRAITIEVVNSASGGNWPVSDKALAATIELCADICKRNGIKKLNFTGNKNGNLTMHKWFANTNCPGPYLESKFPYIAAEVNKKLTITVEKPSTPEPATLYYVQTGAYSVKANADAQYNKVRAAGFDALIKQADGLYRVQVGAYGVKANADAMAAKLKAAGFDTYITTTGGTIVQPGSAQVKKLEVGSKVKINSNATKYSTGQTIPGWVKENTYTVQQLTGEKALLKEIVSWVNVTDLTVV
jgi:TusA-related sulfurtransferase